MEDKIIRDFFFASVRKNEGVGEADLLNRTWIIIIFFKVLDNSVLCLLFPDEFAMKRKECNCMPL